MQLHAFLTNDSYRCSKVIQWRIVSLVVLLFLLNSFVVAEDVKWHSVVWHCLVELWFGSEDWLRWKKDSKFQFFVKWLIHLKWPEPLGITHYFNSTSCLFACYHLPFYLRVSLMWSACFVCLNYVSQINTFS
jgi:hypothetical protein